VTIEPGGHALGLTDAFGRQRAIEIGLARLGVGVAPKDQVHDGVAPFSCGARTFGQPIEQEFLRGAGMGAPRRLGAQIFASASSDQALQLSSKHTASPSR
jgi:hypothetical protein